MTDHVRKQIQTQIRTTLLNLTTTGTNVFNNRVYPLQETELPALLLFTNEETSEPIVIGTSRALQRELKAEIQGIVKQNDNFYATADTIAKEVETAMSADTTLNNLCKDLYIESTTHGFNAEGENPVGVVTLIYLITYMTDEDDPTVAI